MRPLLRTDREQVVEAAVADPVAGDDAPAWRRTAHLAIGLVTAASVVEVVVLGPLSWDGAYLFAQIVERGTPYTPHARVAAALPQVPAWVAAELGAPYAAVRLAFAAGYAAIAPLGLWLAWRVAVAARRPDLVVWPILTTCAVLVPATWFAVSEAVLVADLAWVPWIAAATGLPRGTRAAALVTLAAVLSLHPLGALVALVTAGLLLAPALLRRARPPRDAAAVAAGIVVVALARVTLVGGDADETSAVDPGEIVRSTGGAMKGPQLLGLAAAALVALLLLRGREERDRRALVAAAAVAIAGFVAYAAVPAFWNGGHGSRFAAVLLPVPLTVGLLRDARLGVTPDRAAARRSIAGVIAAGYLAVVVVLAASWWRATDRLDAELAAAPAGCVDRADLAVDREVFDHWTTTILSLVRQGPSPRVVVADHDGGGCARWEATGEVPLETSVDPLRPDGPWSTAP